jgi:hypothetical protein
MECKGEGKSIFTRLAFANAFHCLDSYGLSGEVKGGRAREREREREREFGNNCCALLILPSRLSRVLLS